MFFTKLSRKPDLRVLFLNSDCVNDLRGNFVKNIDTHTLELYSGVDLVYTADQDLPMSPTTWPSCRILNLLFPIGFVLPLTNRSALSTALFRWQSLGVKGHPLRCPLHALGMWFIPTCPFH